MNWSSVSHNVLVFVWLCASPGNMCWCPNVFIDPDISVAMQQIQQCTVQDAVILWTGVSRRSVKAWAQLKCIDQSDVGTEYIVLNIIFPLRRACSLGVHLGNSIGQLLSIKNYFFLSYFVVFFSIFFFTLRQVFHHIEHFDLSHKFFYSSPSLILSLINFSARIYIFMHPSYNAL